MALIPIQGVSDSWLDPGTYVELNFAQGPASVSAGERAICLVMPMTAAGSWTANAEYYPDGEADVIAGAGAGSMTHRAYRAAVYADSQAKIYCRPYAATSVGSPVAATFAVTVTVAATNPTASGRCYVEIGGPGLNGCVASYDFDTTDTATTIAAALKLAVNSATHLPLTSDNAAGVLTLTAKIAGASQGTATTIGIRARTYCDSGCGVTISASGNLGGTVPGADGTTTEAANLLAALATMTGVRRYWIASTLIDSTSHGHLQTHLTTVSAPRPGFRSQGVVCSCGTQANAETAAVARNYERLTLVHQTGTNHDAAHLVGIAVGTLCKAYEADATANLNGIPLPGIDAAYDTADWPDGEDRNDALTDGVTLIGSNEGGAYLVKHVTTRSKTAAGGTVPDYRAWSGHKISGADHFADTVLLRHQQAFNGFKLIADPTDSKGAFNPNATMPRKTTCPSWVKRWLYGIFDEYGPDGLNHLSDITAAKTALRVVRDPNKLSRTESAIKINVIELYDQATFRIDEVSAG
jgi:phage tail sheath gpL-like